jgi:hypothetical protein
MTTMTATLNDVHLIIVRRRDRARGARDGGDAVGVVT